MHPKHHFQSDGEREQKRTGGSVCVCVCADNGLTTDYSCAGAKRNAEKLDLQTRATTTKKENDSFAVKTSM